MDENHYSYTQFYTKKSMTGSIKKSAMNYYLPVYLQPHNKDMIESLFFHVVV